MINFEITCTTTRSHRNYRLKLVYTNIDNIKTIEYLIPAKYFDFIAPSRVMHTISQEPDFMKELSYASTLGGNKEHKILKRSEIKWHVN